MRGVVLRPFLGQQLWEGQPVTTPQGKKLDSSAKQGKKKKHNQDLIANKVRNCISLTEKVNIKLTRKITKKTKKGKQLK